MALLTILISNILVNSSTNSAEKSVKSNVGDRLLLVFSNSAF